MKICQIKSIDVLKGPWLLLVDYGSEGISVWRQFESAQDAVDALAGGSFFGPCAIVYLPNIHCETHIPAEQQTSL